MRYALELKALICVIAGTVHYQSFFSRDEATLYEGVSVHRMVGRSVGRMVSRSVGP